MPNPVCLLTESAREQVFLGATPLIAETMLDMSLKQPNFLRDFYSVTDFPLGSGTTETQLITRAEMPEIERGFDKWKLLPNDAGCAPCAPPDPSYNWTEFGQVAIDRKFMTLMTRDFRSPSFNVLAIQTTAHYEEMFENTVKNLFVQTAFFKAHNIGFNYLTMLAKKFVVDSEGPKVNTADIYRYPNIGTAQISALNISLIEAFYQYQSTDPSTLPFGEQDGMSYYAISASREILADVYRYDPQLRQDLRHSGYADALVNKFNLTKMIRGMYLEIPFEYPRRFKIVDGEPVEVLPVLSGIPAQIGTYSATNPDWINPSVATHEEVLFYGMSPFTIRQMPIAQTLGAGSEFGPQESFMNVWQWTNIKTDLDPMKRVGYYVTSATIGLAPGYSEGIYGILVQRKPVGLLASFFPNGVCPPTPVDCANTIPATGCPCPLITGFSEDPIDGTFFINLSVPTEAEAEDDILFGIDTGGYLTGEVVAVSEDAKTVEVTFAGDPDLGICDHFTSVFCYNSLLCESVVQHYTPNCTDNTRIDLILQNPIRALAGTVSVTFGNGDSLNATVVSVDQVNNKWIVDLGSTVFCDDLGGISKVCVPPGTDATCPACGGVTYEQCEEE